MNSPIELLAPAGSPEALDAAVGEGADAVYMGLGNFGTTSRAGSFTYARFESSLRSLRRLGRKVYVAINLVFQQREADRIYQLLKYLSFLRPDALVVQDFGLLAMARSEFPDFRLHAATKMGIASGGGCNALSRQGVSRVGLARELNIDELRSIRTNTNMELELFVHGAQCVSVSGLCLFSSFLGGKSANRGLCTQPCRRSFQREGEGQGDSGGFYFSPADLQLLDSVPALADLGINAVKIEGRMKSADYVGTVVSAYRTVLDALAEGGEARVADALVRGRGILRGDFARSKTTFFLNDMQNLDWLNPEQDGDTGIALGELLKVRGGEGQRVGLIETPASAPPEVGDSVRLHRAEISRRVTHKLLSVRSVAEGCWLSVPDGTEVGDRVNLIQARGISKRYKPVCSGDAKGGRIPGYEKAPEPAPGSFARPGTKGGEAGPSSGRKRSGPLFPEGLYVAVSQIRDLFVVQSSKPTKVMLHLKSGMVKTLLGGDSSPLPFRREDIIPVLDPFLPEATAETLAEDIPELVEAGYRTFMVNNPGHFPLFRDFRSEVLLIAGPWLYGFNAWALSFVASLGADGFSSPFENNRQNLERTLGTDKSLRDRYFVPVFARPPLFRLRANLGRLYDFRAFSDSRGERFVLANDEDGSRVFPERPFSITDKVSYLREAGFRRFIVDLGGLSLKKADYKDLMKSIENGIPLPNISRFNWKDGFFSEEVAKARPDREINPGLGRNTPRKPR